MSEPVPSNASVTNGTQSVTEESTGYTTGCTSSSSPNQAYVETVLEQSGEDGNSKEGGPTSDKLWSRMSKRPDPPPTTESFEDSIPGRKRSDTGGSRLNDANVMGSAPSSQGPGFDTLYGQRFDAEGNPRGSLMEDLKASKPSSLTGKTERST